MKTTVAAVLGIAVGLVVGAGGMHQWLMPQLMAANAELAALDHENATLRGEHGAMADKVACLERERTSFNDRLEAAEARVEAAEARSARAPDVTQALEEPFSEAVSVLVEEARGDATAEEEETRERGRGDRWGGTPEEREARRQEFMARMQENMTEFFTGELEKSSTPEMEERLVALEQAAYDMMDLRRQMRDAETDEEREALGQLFGETMSNARDLMVAQQRDMLGAIARQFGLSKPGDQMAFERAVRAAVKSPFFSDNPGALLWSAARPEGYGGYGGRGFRGGPDRR